MQYLLSVIILLVAFSYAAIVEPEQVGEAARPLLFAVILLLLLRLIVPAPALASLQGTVPMESQVPFSQSVTKRTAHTLTEAQKVMAWLGVFIAAFFAAIAVTEAVPRFAHYQAALTVVGSVGTVAVALGLITAMVINMDKRTKLIPADEDELKRDRLLRGQGGTGLYKNPDDPMVFVLLPARPMNVTVNLAHQAGYRWAWRMLALAVMVVLGLVAVAFA